MPQTLNLYLKNSTKTRVSGLKYARLLHQKKSKIPSLIDGQLKFNFAFVCDKHFCEKQKTFIMICRHNKNRYFEIHQKQQRIQFDVMLIKTTPSYNTRQGPIGIDKRSSAISTLSFHLNIANSITDMFYLFYNRCNSTILVVTQKSVRN